MPGGGWEGAVVLGGLVAIDLAFQGFVGGRESCYARLSFLVGFGSGTGGTLFWGGGAEG